MLFQKDRQLDPSYCSRDPNQERMQNVLFILYHHLSHEGNAAIIPPLLAAARDMGGHAVRILRLLCRSLFPHRMYQTGPLIARGGYSTVSRSPAFRPWWKMQLHISETFLCQCIEPRHRSRISSSAQLWNGKSSERDSHHEHLDNWRF